MAKQGTLLVVDDNRNILTSLQYLLEEYFQQVITLNSPVTIPSLLQREAIYNPQIQISAESGTKRSIFRQKNKTKRSKNRLHTTLIKPEQKVNEDLCSGFVFS